MVIIKLFALIMLPSLLLFSCSQDQPTLFYQELPFRSHICWTAQDRQYKASVFSLPSKDGSRSITLEFISPDTLCGIVVKKDGENSYAELDGTNIPLPDTGSLLGICSLFEIDASVTKSEVDNSLGAKLNHIQAKDKQGNEFSIWLFPDSGLPRKICSSGPLGSYTLDVISFEIVDQ